jgi:hypothetical protein
MDVERLDDGIEYADDQETASLTLELREEVHEIAATRLQPLRDLRDHASSADPDEIAAVLGHPVDTFDGDPRYHGRVDGTELYYDVVEGGDQSTMVVASFGEVQPGRYAVAAEALVWFESDRS